MTDNTQDEKRIAELEAQLKELTQEFESAQQTLKQLIKSKGKDLKHFAKDKLEDAEDEIDNWYAQSEQFFYDARDRAVDGYNATLDYVCDNPWRSAAGIATVVGAIVGVVYLLNRDDKKSYYARYKDWF